MVGLSCCLITHLTIHLPCCCWAIDYVKGAGNGNHWPNDAFGLLIEPWLGFWAPSLPLGPQIGLLGTDMAFFGCNLAFLVACTRLCKPLCWSVHWSIRRSVAALGARNLWRSALFFFSSLFLFFHFNSLSLLPPIFPFFFLSRPCLQNGVGAYERR